MEILLREHFANSARHGCNGRLCSQVALRVCFLSFVAAFLLSGCHLKTESGPSSSSPAQSDKVPTWNYTCTNGKTASVVIRTYPKSKVTEKIFTQRNREFQKEIENIRSWVNQENREKQKGILQRYLAEVMGGEAFLAPFSLNDWPILMPSRVLPAGDEEALCLVVARYEPTAVDVTFTISSKGHLSPSEIKNLILQIVDSFTKSGSDIWNRVPMARNPIFDKNEKVIDPSLQELLKNQVFLERP